jgi:hypothetical protein
MNAASQQRACTVSASRRSNTAHEEREHVGLYLDCLEDLIPASHTYRAASTQEFNTRRVQR